MKERPILFSGDMVRAILEGRKTQTRRAVKNLDPQNLVETMSDAQWRKVNRELPPDFTASYLCAYGQPGDRLWVREKHRLWFPMLNNGNPVDDYWHVRYAADNTEIKTRAGYDCDCDSPAELGIDIEPAKWRPSIHMPRWASRITLEITGVRVERLCQISEDDARAEGVQDGGCVNCGNSSFPNPCGCRDPHPSYVDAFDRLWMDINDESSWHRSPWVWVIEFKRVEAAA